MKKTLFTLIATFAILLISDTVVEAAPKAMSDGTIFDASFYALMNPDVVMQYGTDESALYKHYQNYGKREGRLPAMVATTTQIPGTATTTPAVQAPAVSTNPTLDLLRAKYPNGTSWGTYSVYSMGRVIEADGFARKGGGFNIYGSEGLAWLISDTVRGITINNVHKYHNVITTTNPAIVMPGDTVLFSDSIFDMGPPNHQSIIHAAYVLSVDYAARTITVVEGNVGGTVQWDLSYSFDNIAEVWRPEADRKGQEHVVQIRDGVLIKNR